jgi:hypothetical protein
MVASATTVLKELEKMQKSLPHLAASVDPVEGGGLLVGAKVARDGHHAHVRKVLGHQRQSLFDALAEKRRELETRKQATDISRT